MYVVENKQKIDQFRGVTEAAIDFALLVFSDKVWRTEASIVRGAENSLQAAFYILAGGGP